MFLKFNIMKTSTMFLLITSSKYEIKRFETIFYTQMFFLEDLFKTARPFMPFYMYLTLI